MSVSIYQKPYLEPSPTARVPDACLCPYAIHPAQSPRTERGFLVHVCVHMPDTLPRALAHSVGSWCMSVPICQEPCPGPSPTARVPDVCLCPYARNLTPSPRPTARVPGVCLCPYARNPILSPRPRRGFLVHACVYMPGTMPRALAHSEGS